MATDFIMPRLPDLQQQPAFLPHYQRQQQLRQPPTSQPAFQQAPMRDAIYVPPSVVPFHSAPATQYTNPQISPLSTSGSSSPTSPRPGIARQIRPMYMPAVLRPTEFPSKAPEPQAKPEDEADADDQPLRSSNSFMSLPGLSAFGRLSRRSTGDSGKCVNGDWNLDLFPEPTGPPTRKHWKCDQESSVCDHTTCKRYFSYFVRRHHCRKCGNIFCDMHSTFEIPLDQDTNFNPRGSPSRACAHCHFQFKEWRSRTNSQASSLTSSDGGKPGDSTLTSPTSIIGGRTAHPSEVAHSVPRDWNWSTF
ncbi:hypothetical protein B0T24DRAFT_154774 [Lasiosphaeria ovina]|uniref:FYVE-type domain-containing protein n=1 Tax=Lasiosphaeria ovina TaxID=92902 RepID=A0AAE0KNB2_9PEZI|nr:hypothetical protein B0T24DRAFT_154774 [Lasiosphaeria ovina]